MRKDQVFLFVCLGEIVGVFTGSFFVAVWWVILLLFAAWVALLVAFPERDILLLVLPLALFSLGIFSAQDSLDRFRTENMHTGTVSGIARVVNDPEERSFYRHTIVRMESCDNAYCPPEKILWQAPRTKEIPPGSRIAFSCALAVPENFDANFDYRMFLAKDDIGYLCRQALRAEMAAEDMRARLMRIFFLPKRAFETALEKTLPQPEAGLAEGLILGGDNRLSENLKQAFITAGLSHIVAISGYNIALIAHVFIFIGLGIGLWRRQALGFAALCIILFIVLVGAPASAVRAGIMALTVFAALLVGRLSQSVHMLVAAAVLMLIFQPLLLRYDVGFQLSFLATLAIIAALPLIGRILPKEFLGKTLVEIAFLTFSVELFVVPLLAYQFQSLFPFALFANVLLLPLVPYAMATAFTAGVAFFVLPGLHLLPAALGYAFLRSITFAAEHISLWPGATTPVSVGVPALLLWYVGLFFAIVMIQRRIRKKYVPTKNIS